ncbi:MAG TPA: cytochrome c3 family protein [Blastocatellia bacterium]|nr:cytochrome c3 family protein [Blastocatellia bacterium]
MWTQKIKIALVMTCAALCVAAVMANTESAKPATSPAPAATPAQTEKDYSKFTHKSHSGAVKIPGTSQTKDLDCAYCHERNADLTVAQAEVATTKRNEKLQVKFPGHKACTECHIQQFTAQPLKTCTICHDSSQTLTTRPPQRDFPKRTDFSTFFDTKQHEAHYKYKLPDGKEAGCVFCHTPRSKPAAVNIAVHAECYACHSPASGDQKASQKSGCVACHTQMVESVVPYSVKYTSRAWGAMFTHRKHATELGIDCQTCHTISGGYNQPVPTSIKTKQHLTEGERSGRGCFSCHDGGTHNGRTVFSGEDFNSCGRCHTRADKKVFPTQG